MVFEVVGFKNRGKDLKDMTKSGNFSSELGGLFGCRFDASDKSRKSLGDFDGKADETSDAR